MKNRFFILTAAAVLTAFLIILSGCPAPLEPEKLALLQDLDAPRIIVTSPQDYGEYATVIELEGYIEDESIGSLPADTELDVSYSIPGSSISGKASVNPANGTFSAVINASELHGDQVIELSAADINGNTATAAVNIRKPEGGGDISGFTVTPANKQVTISWDPVPGAESYSIFESRYGHTVEAEEISGTEYTWTGLTNGEKYTFQLTGHLQAGFGDDAVSAEVTKMPLSPRSLAPWVKETGYKSITIEWRENPNVKDYVVERSLSPMGPWEVRRNLTEHEFTDTEVEHDTTYYYRVTPSEFDDVVSEYTDGELCGFQLETFETIDIDGGATKISYNGNYLYMSSENGEVFIFILKTPGPPEIVTSFLIPGKIDDFLIKESYLYISYAIDSENGALQIVDITDPINPDFKGLISYSIVSSEAAQIAVSGDYAYLANTFEDADVLIIDVSNKSVPKFCEPYNTPSGSLDSDDIFYDGNYLYLLTWSEGFCIIDISSPESPTLISTIKNLNDDSSLRTVITSGSYAYVLTGTKMYIIDISDIYSPVFKGSCYVDWSENVFIDRERAYIPYSHYSIHGLGVIDIENPETPRLIRTIWTEDYLADAVILGNNAYIASRDSGLQILALDDSNFPTLKSNYQAQDFVLDVDILGNYAYLAEGSKGIEIIDISNPLTPYFISRYNTEHSAIGITVAGNSAYIAVGEKGFQIIDLAIPDKPILTGNYFVDDFVEKVGIGSSYAYLACGDHGLQVVDISDKFNPEYEALYTYYNNINALSVNGTILTKVYEDEIRLYDISDIANPDLKGGFTSEFNISGITYRYPFVYITDYNFGFQIIGMKYCSQEDEHFMYLADSCQTPGAAGGAAIHGRYAYVADGDAGLAIIDLLGNE